MWKRYSETGDLDKRMRGQYGWQMEKVKFPPKKTFGNLDPVFLEKRREGLDFYFHEILAISDVADVHVSKLFRTCVSKPATSCAELIIFFIIHK